MKQSYTKEQHENAKNKQMALICIGFDTRYMEKAGGSAIQWGPIGPKGLKSIQKLFVKLAKDKS